ncbi:MAG: BTAD domain-containing putative transcriptional regulator, partial [Gemmatimonadota bacterium]
MSIIPTARLLVLGGATLEGDRGPIAGRSAQRRRLGLLAILASSARPVSRDKLIGYLWEEADTDKARRLLSESVYVIRKSLGEDALLSSGNDLRLNPDALWSDVAAFTGLLEAGDDEGAIALYAGPLLDGFFISDAHEFEQWVDRERDRLARLYADAVTRLARWAEQGGDYQAAAKFWRKLSEHDPYSAMPVLALMRALDAINDRPAALQVARAHGERLQDQLGGDPDPQVEAFARELKAAPAGESPPRIKPEPEPEPEVFAEWPRPTELQAAVPLNVWQRSRVRRAILVGSALAIIAALGALAIGINRRPPVSTLKGSVTLAILPFTANESASQWRSSLAKVLANNLGGAGQLQTVDPYALSNRTVRRSTNQLTPDEAARIAKRHGAQFFVLGNILEAAGKYTLTATLYNTERPDSMPRRAQTTPLADLFAAIDTLSRQLLIISGQPNASLRRTAATLTSSFAAFKSYVTGDDYFLAGQYDSAVIALKAAVAQDSNFALAYYRLSAAAEWNFDFQDARVFSQRALSLAARLPAQQQVLVTAWDAFLGGRPEAAARSYNSILTRDPHNVEARAGLGEVLVHYNPVRGQRSDSAGPLFEGVLQQVPEYGEARFHVLELAARDRDLPRFDSVAGDLHSRNPQGLAWQAVRAALTTSDDRERVLNELRGADAIAIGIAAGRVAAHTHNFPYARQIAQLLTASNQTGPWRAAAHLMLAEIALARNDWPAAQRELADAKKLDNDWHRQLTALFLLHPFVNVTSSRLIAEKEELLTWDTRDLDPNLSFFLAAHAPVRAELRAYLLGLLNAASGDYDAAKRYQDTLSTIRRELEETSFAQTLAQSLRGHIAAAKGETADAVRILEEVSIQARPELLALSPFYSRAHDR